MRGRPPGPGCRQVRGDPGPGGVVEIGVVASGAHGSRNRADEPCFARGGSTSQTPSNFVTKREDAAAASKSFLRTCAPAAGVDDVLSTVVSLPPQVEFWFSTTHIITNEVSRKRAILLTRREAFGIFHGRKGL